MYVDIHFLYVSYNVYFCKCKLISCILYIMYNFESDYVICLEICGFEYMHVLGSNYLLLHFFFKMYILRQLMSKTL